MDYANKTPEALFQAENTLNAETTINRLGALQTLSEVLSQHLNLETLLESVIDIVFSELRACNGSILLLEDSCDHLIVAACRGTSNETKNSRIPMGAGIAGRVAASGKPLLVQGFANQTTPVSPADAGDRPFSSLCVPLFIRNQVRGVICANQMTNQNCFSYKDLQMLQIMASQTATAIDNVTLLEGLKSNNYAVIRSLAEAVEVKDPYTAGHCDYVARYCVYIAQAMKLPDREIEEIKIGAILHDVGKIGISEDILSKTSKLTEAEFEIMKQHPVQGAKIVAPLSLPKNSMHVIKYHHERPDGKGYPYGLTDNEIYIGAKIAMVADTFDAMTSNRPYRSGLPIEVAVREIHEGKGTQFDPQAAEAFLAHLPTMIAEGVLRPHLCHPPKNSPNDPANREAGEETITEIVTL